MTELSSTAVPQQPPPPPPPGAAGYEQPPQSYDDGQASPWLTAAIPMEDPYCSCKLTAGTEPWRRRRPRGEPQIWTADMDCPRTR